MIAVFVNARSRANRRNPKLGAELQAILGDEGRVIEPQSLDQLASEAAALRAQSPSVVAVHGGDGTLHKTLTALVRAWGDAPLPPLAVLCGGTMNVVATSLGIREQPQRFVRHLAESARAGAALATMRRRCLHIGDHHGFIFGNGLMANFLTEYYAPGGYGTRRAIWLVLRVSASALVYGAFARRVFRRFEGVVKIDGAPIDWPSFVTIGAATVREVGLGFKLIHRADDDTERFGVVAVHAGPLALIPDLWGVHAGRGIAANHAFSAVASAIDIEPADGAMAYTIDGDLYRNEGPLHIGLGPPIDFVKPPGGSLVRRS
jgi:diacylglycerol kinase family enzyme